MEIERKFLVDRIPGELTGSPGTPIQQGYLAIDEESEVRLRRAGNSLTLTVKSGHGESRGETEVELDVATFEELWPDTEGRRIMKVRHKTGLDGGLVAELDLYSGDLEGLATVEVEFASDAEAGSFDVPAWFGRELTGDQAWANQALAAHGRPAKSLEYRLRPGEDPASGICRVIAARAAQATAAVRTAGSSEDSAEHVHEARKSLKKVRSALRLLRGVIEDQDRDQANDSCREAARHLSGARDAEVKLSVLDSVSGQHADPSVAEGWRGQLHAEAEVHRGDLTPENLAEVAAAIESVRRGFQGRELPGEQEAVAGNVGRGYRRGRKSMKQAGKTGEAVHFHDWRKRAKDLRYQLEILEPRLPDEMTGIRKLAEELADKLGDLHDLDVLKDDLAGRDLAESDRETLGGVIDEARKRQADECLELGKRVYRLKPGRFTNRVGESLTGEA